MPQITLIVAKSTQPRRLTCLSLHWRPAPSGSLTAGLAVLNALAPWRATRPLAAPGRSGPGRWAPATQHGLGDSVSTVRPPRGARYSAYSATTLPDIPPGAASRLHALQPDAYSKRADLDAYAAA